MAITIVVNGESISYPQTGDTGWGGQATEFAEQTASAFGALGLSSGTTVDIPGTLDVTGATTLDSTLTVAGTTTLDSTLTVAGTTTIDGVTYLDDNTTANTPVISFTGDTNTGIGRSAADTLDFITNGNSRFRIESTGQIKAVYESTEGTDYNTTLHNGYLCRAWVNFNGQNTVTIRASGNVTSLVDNSTGSYQVNFTTSMPDANYSVLAIVDWSVTGEGVCARPIDLSTSNIGEIRTIDSSGNYHDFSGVYVAVFR